MNLAATIENGLVELLATPELASILNRSLGLGGLRADDGRAFPLTNVKVRASLAGPCARTVIEQHFTNPFDEALDVTWIFPIPTDGAITDLVLTSGDIRVVGECKEKAEAQATYDAARAQGKRAALVEKEMGDTHTLSLAGLPARSDVTIHITLVQLLPAMDGRFRWHFPTTIAPRYTPGLATGHTGFGTEHDTNLVPNASRLTPPVRLAGGTSLDLEVEIAGPVTAIESSLHAVKLTLDSGTVRVAPSTKATLNKDFILDFTSADSSATATRAYTDGVHTLVLVEPPVSQSAHALPRDAVFAIDISGSMEGAKLNAAKVAMQGALHGLRTGDRFKLLAFDDRVELMSPDFLIYNDRSLANADKWISKLDARGGTEMLPAIQKSLEGDTPKGRLRTVLFITDGQSNDEYRLLPAVANRRGDTVFFTLGIDTAVNASLLQTLARAGGGVCELCTPNDNIDSVVARLESRFGSPLLSNLKVAGAARPDGQTVFAGRPASVLVENAPATLTVNATSADGAFETTVVATPISFALGALWAMERIAYLEERLTLKPFEDEAIRPEIVKIALKWHVGSKFTSFVCVDHSTVTKGQRRHVVQPTEMPESWSVQDTAHPISMTMYCGAAPAPMASPSMEDFDSTPTFIRRQMPDSPEASAPLPPPPPSASASMPLGAFGGALSDGVARSRGMLNRILSPNKKSEISKLADSPSERLAEDSFAEFAGTLARSQSADGSFGGDIGRTSAALLVLLLLGNTTLRGDRRRTVQKAAAWLEAQNTDDRIMLALLALGHAEQKALSPVAAWRSLSNEGAEGQMLVRILDQRGV